MYGSVRGALSDERPYRDSNASRVATWHPIADLTLKFLTQRRKCPYFIEDWLGRWEIGPRPFGQESAVIIGFW
jgi:hypothetical protein